MNLDISERLPGKFLATCSACPWELWSTGNLAHETLRESWERHTAQKHPKQGRLL